MGVPRGAGLGCGQLGAGAVDEFVSIYTYRLDGKGRVSIPAEFRAVLSRDGFDGVYCCPSPDLPAVDAGGNLLRDRIRQYLARVDPLSPDYDQLATMLAGVCEVLKIDPKDGRVVLSDAIRNHAAITDQVTFVGQIYKFQIWEPTAFAAYREEAKSRLRAIRQSAPGHRASGANEETSG
jgi:MraZ protein